MYRMARPKDDDRTRTRCGKVTGGASSALGFITRFRSEISLPPLYSTLAKGMLGKAVPLRLCFGPEKFEVGAARFFLHSLRSLARRLLARLFYTSHRLAFNGNRYSYSDNRLFHDYGAGKRGSIAFHMQNGCRCGPPRWMVNVFLSP